MPGQVWLVAGEPAAETARWQSPSAECQNRTARLAVSGDLVAVDAATVPVLQEVADVIFSDHGEPVSWLSDRLDRYPGCAMTAMPIAGGGYLVATRECLPLIFHCLLDHEPRLRAVPGSGVVVCAMFVYAWLAAGWPLAALNPASLELVRPYSVATVTPVPFALYYEGPAGPADPASGPNSVSRRCISPVSGAPIAE